MKKYLLLACVAIAMLAVGCSKDKRIPVVIEKCYYKFSSIDYSVIEHKTTPVQ